VATSASATKLKSANNARQKHVLDGRERRPVCVVHSGNHEAVEDLVRLEHQIEFAGEEALWNSRRENDRACAQQTQKNQTAGQLRRANGIVLVHYR
jgi:hypothetical protein